MIGITRRDGVSIVLHADEILQLEQLADSIITLKSGNKLFVRESVDEIVRRIIYYRQQIYNPEWAAQQSHPLKTAI